MGGETGLETYSQDLEKKVVTRIPDPSKEQNVQYIFFNTFLIQKSKTKQGYCLCTGIKTLYGILS